MLLRPLIFDHFWLKLLSLVLASLIWLTVKSSLGTSGDESKRIFSNRPIMLLTDSGEHVAMVANPNVASVTVRGPASIVQSMGDQDILVYVRLHDRPQGGDDFPVHAHTPSGTKVILVMPGKTSVKPVITP